ncbi:DUF4124 domain-containing protein [Massilia sp. G4R7]|uniref:DUF4124 domain-containing protein n=1 Tax=Massilia phyllostachyos TaxID=2898585 RepID=A0ABS8QB59_9BURK|nr:DUF4124 domain-containing protein [Massilia phyllostachyos]MCD2518976.1 DUF4124 domain-containing protein [Massilia phyllostachyos]
MPHPTALLRLFAASALLLGSSLAQAQYSWIGENGVRQFSDRPPPPSTPPSKILKAPGRAYAAPAAEPPAAAPAETKPAPGWAAREADYRKRMKEREEQDKKNAQQADRQRDVEQRCEWARTARAQVESGIRIGNVDPQGERRFASDEERAAQLARANKILSECR